MEAQTTLPFPEWQVSPRWGALLAIVNTWARWLTSYDAAQWHLYRLKDKILMRHGVPDGTDLQILTLTCRACDGRGYFGWRYHECCRKCVGSGEFARDYITLGRYRLGQHVFHVPNGLSRFRVMDEDRERHWTPDGTGHRGVIHGRVAGGPAPHHRWRWLAFLALTLRFDPKGTGQVLRLWRHDAQRSINAWWCWGNGAVWRYRCSEALAGRPVDWGRDRHACNADQVPF